MKNMYVVLRRPVDIKSWSNVKVEKTMCFLEYMCTWEGTSAH